MDAFHVFAGFWILLFVAITLAAPALVYLVSKSGKRK